MIPDRASLKEPHLGGIILVICNGLAGPKQPHYEAVALFPSVNLHDFVSRVELELPIPFRCSAAKKVSRALVSFKQVQPTFM